MICSLEHRSNLSKSIKKGYDEGRIVWNKGKKGVQVSWRKGKGKPKVETICEYCGNIFLHDSWQKRKYCSKKCYGKFIVGKERNCRFTEEWKNNIKKSADSSFLMGKTIWNKGKTNIYSDGSRQRMGVEKGNIPWNKDKTKETDERILSYSGENHGLWNGGSSFEPYGIEFNDVLKNQIRLRDSYTCQLCKIEENGRHLDIHHIDYDKKNNTSFNLISLCNCCHMKTNHNRVFWSDFFFHQQLDRSIYG